ncbi:MAG: NUDIX domain-containing protein [Turicibacter sp.]|nr:NUDIX domain-containing protein [Turicibacter sp.]
MMFDELLGLEEVPEGVRVKYRTAVRAVVFAADGKLIMIHNRRGDVKFPGGGVQEGESQLEALKREVAEEAGVLITDRVKVLGEMKEQRESSRDDADYFVMNSIYYVCEFDRYTGTLRLDDYEADLAFEPVEIDIEAAYLKNLSVLKNQVAPNFWVERETLVLQHLRRNKEELVQVRKCLR